MAAARLTPSTVLLLLAIPAMCLVSLGHASESPATIDSPLSDPWFRVESAHLVILTNSDAATGTAVARRIERLREVFETIGAPLRSEADLPTIVLLFRDSKSFDPYRIKFHGKVRQDAGLFVRSTRANYLVVDASSSLDVALHEYTHLLVSLSIPRPSIWLNEGLAEFYSTFEAKGRSADIGRPIALYRLQLAKEGILPTQELRSITHAHPIYHSGDKRWMVYAESWALVHMLQFGVTDGREHFRDFIERLSRGQGESEALAGSYPGLDDNALDVRLRDYLGSRMTLPYVQIEFSRSFDAIQSRVSEADLADVVESLADFLASHVDDDPDALVRHFHAAEGIAPVTAIARAGLGAAAEARHDTAAANQFYERALALPAGPDLDRRRRVIVARALMERGAAGAYRARQILESLVQGDKPSVDALVLQGHSYVVTGEDDIGIGTLMLAQSVAPRRLDVASDMVVLQARSGNPAAALHVYRALLLGSDRPSVESPALEALVRAQWKRIDALAKNGQLERADSLRVAFLKALDGAELSALVANWPDQLAISGVNQALTAANRQDYEGALQLLDRSLVLAQSPSLRDDIQKRQARVAMEKQLLGVDRMINHSQWREAKAALDEIVRQPLEPEDREIVVARMRVVEKRLAAKRR
jgi:tetratricopeptide (TPR) repeat protein